MKHLSTWLANRFIRSIIFFRKFVRFVPLPDLANTNYIQEWLKSHSLRFIFCTESYRRGVLKLQAAFDYFFCKPFLQLIRRCLELKSSLSGHEDSFSFTGVGENFIALVSVL